MHEGGGVSISRRGGSQQRQQPSRPETNVPSPLGCQEQLLEPPISNKMSNILDSQVVRFEAKIEICPGQLDSRLRHQERDGIVEMRFLG